jgi:hypothetical protein
MFTVGACGSGERRVLAAVASGGGSQWWLAAVARSGGSQWWLAAVARSGGSRSGYMLLSVVACFNFGMHGQAYFSASL